MGGATTEDPRVARRLARLDSVLAAAWDIAHEDGLGAVSLHEVARRVGLRQPSLYTYVDSKAALFDAMFGGAARALLQQVTTATYSNLPREAVVEMSRAIVEFSTVDPARTQLLFLRTLPGFEPSAASYAIAVEFQDWVVGRLALASVHNPADVDIYTALIGGLSSQQISNDPGGDRWTRHLKTVLSMFFDHIDRGVTRERIIAKEGKARHD
jgi:AcrR family transcriptional regulator